MRLIHTIITSLACICTLTSHTIAQTSPAWSLRDFYSQNQQLDKEVETVFANLSDWQRAGQMIISVGGKSGYPKSKLDNLLAQNGLGGILLLSGEKNELTNLAKSFDQQSVRNGGLPLLFSADAEPSLINRKISGLPSFPKTNTLTSATQSVKTAVAISNELNKIGIQQNFAPICDFSKNEDIIGNRSFGNNANSVAPLAVAFAHATQENNIIATAKHFPGHGNVKGDSHKKLVYIDGEMPELPVFAYMIKEEVTSIMVGHIAVQNNPDFDTDGMPSSCSRLIVTDLLKQQMQFKGLVVTDAMTMGALKQIPNAALKAVEAGIDMVLMPASEAQLHQDILQKMETNAAFKAQVYESVKKVIRMKICLGIVKPALYKKVDTELKIVPIGKPTLPAPIKLAYSK
ncbi:glycoside hydrolase family 3 N-terminal domain-containing protein [Limibacter armeniacum]|uniref:glycoside hydrolase family 3 N-terminal domain-containing protein n=1 Tax=Limibacter armeniacum TaxID=466084 RepID=UPI002FE5DADF